VALLSDVVVGAASVVLGGGEVVVGFGVVDVVDGVEVVVGLKIVEAFDEVRDVACVELVVELEAILEEEVDFPKAWKPSELLKVWRADDWEEKAGVEVLNINEGETVEVTTDELKDDDSEEVFVPLLPEMFCIGPTEEDPLVG